jgi:hypothetical protein
LAKEKIGRNDPCHCGSGKKWKKCHGSPTAAPEALPYDFSSFLDYVQSQPSPSALCISDLGPYLSDLTTELQNYDPQKVIPASAALASLAENHTLIYRINALILLASLACKGTQTPSVTDLDLWLNRSIAESPAGRLEDPAEDFAIGLVRTRTGDRLIFNGSLSGPDAYLQDVLDALREGPASLTSLISTTESVLTISNELVSRRGYDRFTSGSGPHEVVVVPESDEALWRLVLTQTFTAADFPNLTTFASHLQPFSFTLDELRKGAAQSTLVRSRQQAFLRLGDAYLLIFPASVADALIEFTLRELNARNMIRGFNNELNRQQGGRIFDDARRHFGAETVVADEQRLNALPRPVGVSDVVLRFDHNRYFHLVLLHDDMRDVVKDGFDTTRQPNSAVADHISNAATILSKRSDYVNGFTLVVMLGVGRAYEVAIPTDLPPDWFLQVWSLYDFERLQWLEPNWESMLWKLSKQRNTLSKRQIEYFAPDDAILYASWMNDDYRLIPGGATEPGPLLTPIFCGEVFCFREMARLRLDTHAAYRADSQSWVTVCRVNPLSYFKDDQLSLRYGAPNFAAQGLLAGAIVTPQRTWWIDCNARLYPDADRLYLMKVWETANIWMARVAAIAEQQLHTPVSQNPIITLNVSGVAAIKDWSMSALESVTPVTEFATEIDSHGFTVMIPAAFVTMGRSPENRAEMFLAKALVTGAARLGGKLLSGSEAEAEIAALHVSPDERHMHTIVASDHRDYLREFAQDDFHLLGDADTHFADADVAYEAGFTGPILIEGRDEANDCLKKIVDAFWQRCKRDLERLDRCSLVIRCLSNNEAVLAEQENWTRTRRAVAALHKDREDVLSASLSVRQKMDRTQISNRLLVEMAICTCPEVGGREANQENIDHLCAQVLQLSATAQEADAMRAEAIPPWVRFGLAGDVRLASDFSDLMRPYMSSHFEITHESDVARYERHLEEPKRGSKTEVEVFGETFLNAFLDEYGISPIRLADIATILAEDAHQQQRNVIVRSKDNLRARLSTQGYSEAEIDGLFRHFVLPARPDWTVVSPPFRSKDWWPWRYKRKLSVMNRPLIALNDTEVAYAPAFCEDSFRHVVSEVFTGSFEPEYFTTPAMRKYVGSANAASGLEFNKSVASRFRAAGWNSWNEIEMSRLQCPKDQATGDIDVVAEKDGTVFVCECKDLSFARTITEVVEQLGRFKGKHGDELWKHLRRAAWVKNNGSRLRHVIGREPAEIRSLLISSKIVPMQHAKGFAEQVVPIDSLPEFLNALY